MLVDCDSGGLRAIDAAFRRAEVRPREEVDQRCCSKMADSLPGIGFRVFVRNIEEWLQKLFRAGKVRRNSSSGHKS